MNRAYDVEVEELPAFPIVLRKYKWITALYLAGGLMFSAIATLVACIILAAFYGDTPQERAWALHALIPPFIILFALSTALVGLSASNRIVLEPDKLTYRHWGKNTSLDFHDIANHKIILGYLTVQRKSDGSTMKIPLEFQNIHYLKEVLKRWFAQLSEKHHFVYPN